MLGLELHYEAYLLVLMPHLVDKAVEYILAQPDGMLSFWGGNTMPVLTTVVAH